MKNTPAERFAVVEFVGLPGCGKTTIFNLLRQELEMRPEFLFGPDELKNIARGRLSRLGKVAALLETALSLVTHSGLYFQMLMYGIQARGLSIQLINHIFIHARSAVRIDSAKGKRTGPNAINLILDQGLAQGIGTISTPGADRKIPDPRGLVRRLIKGRVDRIIFLLCNQQLAIRRIGQRSHGTSRFDVGSKQPFEHTELSRMDSVLRQVIEACKYTGIPVLELSPEKMPEENMEIIRSWLFEEND